MSLRLRQTVAGKPSRHSSQALAGHTVDNHAYIAYTSSSNVVLLNEELELTTTLPFWDALPRRSSSSAGISDVKGVIASGGLIIAWSEQHVVLWRLQSGKTESIWVTHSSVLASDVINTADYQDGSLILGTEGGLELWRAGQDRDVVFWDRLWSRSYPSPTSVCLTPSASHIAWFTLGQRSVHILALNKKGDASGIPQELRHPREISWAGWRKGVSSSGDAVLYTITTNTVFRVYSPVLDDPTWFQLLSTVDHRAFRPETAPPSLAEKGKGREDVSLYGHIWPLDAEVLRAALLGELGEVHDGKIKPTAMTRKLLEGLASEESDVLLYTDGHGLLSMRSIVNLDRKPPTLLESLPVSRIRVPEGGELPAWSSSSVLLHVPASSSLLAINAQSGQIQARRLSLSQLLSSDPSGVSPLPSQSHKQELAHVQLSGDLDHFVRTPNGRGLMAVGETGEIGIWSKEQVGKPVPGETPLKSLAGKGQWRMPTKPLQCAIFAKGRAIVLFTRTEDAGPVVTLQHFDPGSDEPTPPIGLPHFDLDAKDDLAMLLAVSDIDDGISSKGRRTQRAIIMAVSDSGEAWTWRVTSRYAMTTDSEIDLNNDRPDIQLLHKYKIPVQGGQAPAWVLPVDPMGWHQSVIDWKTDTPLQDMVLTISKDGVLEFWQPRLGQHLVEEEDLDGNISASKHTKTGSSWMRSGSVETGRTAIVSARCSSRKKTVLICDMPDGRQEATIWDSNVSEFSTGLELTYIFDEDERVQDLDWTTTSDLQSVLAVGFPHRVVLICEQRMSYSEKGPGWAPFITINLEKYTSVPINDSIWLAGGSLAVGAGNQIYLFSRFLDRDTPIPSPAASGRSVSLNEGEPEDLFQMIAWKNGPLLDYHPTILSQCLIWDKMELAKRILVDLHMSLKDSEEAGRRRLAFKRLDPFDFVTTKINPAASPKSTSKKYDSLFDAHPTILDNDDEEFNEKLVRDLVKRLDGPVQVPLSTSDRALLATIVEGTFEAEQQRRALDICGLRYLISVEQLASHYRRHDSPLSPADSTIAHKHRLSFRNIVWATHSESQDMLLNASTRYCTAGKMMWDDATRLGVFLWLKSSETIKSQLEIIARNTFMAQEDRDPTGCSLIFFALGKKKVVHGLWKQAPGHKEQNMMLKFLGNDFTQDRWKTAALKNAYALLSKNRYEYAASFFMLADQPKDAINVCLRQLGDWQLAVALARAVEPGPGGPLLNWVLTDTVIPLAFEGGHRWLASWAFWTIGRRDMSVRVLISPLSTVASAWSPTFQLPVGLSENDDPSLLLLFQYLKSKSLQTAKGTSEIPSKLEFDFVLHNARVFFRMGCHSLALDLLRNWSFERPFFPLPSTSSRANKRPEYSPVRQRRPSFMLSNGHGRRESMVMDMDVLADSPPVSRATSPPPIRSNGAIQEETDDTGAGEAAEPVKTEDQAKSAVPIPAPAPMEEQPKKMGNLMKELKQDVTQGAMEFNMDSFF